MADRVIIVNLEEPLQSAIRTRLEKDHHRVTFVQAVAELGKEISARPDTAAVIVDIPSVESPAWAVLHRIREGYPKVQWIVTTHNKDRQMAMLALRYRAHHFVELPVADVDLYHTVQQSLKEFDAETYRKELLLDLQARVQRLEGHDEDRFWFVSKAKAMEPVNEWLTTLRRESLKGNPEPCVLISGEVGTGKEGIARMVYAASRRAKRAWITLNCSNLSSEEIETELFGHDKRPAHPHGQAQIHSQHNNAQSQLARRGLIEIADGGTIFLQELGELGGEAQAKLTRFLQSGVFKRVGGTEDIHADVRFLVSTSSDLKSRVAQGKLREDLYSRIAQVSITIPPLRDRKEDIIMMANQFARQTFKDAGKKFEGLQAEVEKSLTEYSWPGNVRELYAVIEYATWTSGDRSQISPRDLILKLSGGANGNAGLYSVPKMDATIGEHSNYTALKKQWCDAFEKEYLIMTLKRNHGNVSAAAREAKLDRSNFLRLLRRHHLKAQDYRKISTTHIAVQESKAA